jgi:parvulin-like peptidyl-prolyl isomerase
LGTLLTTLHLSPTVLLLAALACRDTRPSDPVILVLGNESVRWSEFERHVKALEARGMGTVDPGVRSALLEPFLEERVLVLEARGRGILKPDASAEEEQMAAQKLLADQVAAGLIVTEDEVAAHYRDHAEAFQAPETVTLRQVLLSSEREARDVRRRLLKDPKSLELVAQSRSRSPEASKGGLMGTFRRGELPSELEAAAFALPVSGVSDVVPSPLGFHVLRVDARQNARERTLEECREEIRALLTRQKSDQATRQFVRDLLARAKVNHETAQRSLPSS